jgi:hypothetical protein
MSPEHPSIRPFFTFTPRAFSSFLGRRGQPLTANQNIIGMHNGGIPALYFVNLSMSGHNSLMLGLEPLDAAQMISTPAELAPEEKLTNHKNYIFQQLHH